MSSFMLFIIAPHRFDRKSLFGTGLVPMMYWMRLVAERTVGRMTKSNLASPARPDERFASQDLL